MEFIGLLFEFIFLALGITLYRFGSGKMRFAEAQRQMAEQFRKENGNWMRILGLALTAMMCIEILLHIVQLFKK